MTTTDPAATITGQQGELIAAELPDYHGRPAVGMKTTVSGAGKRITRPHEIGDRVVAVVELRTRKSGHEQTDDGILYVEALKVEDLFELPGDQGARLLSTMRSLYRMGDDARAGRVPLPGTVVHTDGSGVVLTEAELAELRGDPVRAVLSDSLTPVVVVYNDGTRELWPDDFPKDTIRPTVGQVFENAGITLEVIELLHHATGETIAGGDASAVERVIGIPCTCGAINLVPPAADGYVVAGSLHRLDGPCYDYDGEDTPAAPPADGFDEAAVVATLDGTPDPYSGDIADDATGWEDPDPATSKRLADADNLPGVDDFAFVSCPITDLIVKLRDVRDIGHARRLLTAERQGRGTGARPRKQAEHHIGVRIAELEDAAAE